MTDLAKTRDELRSAVQDGLAGLLPDTTFEVAGDILEEACRGLIALGLCHLLIDGSVPRCGENLVRAGHARRHLLERARRAGITTHRHLASSRWDAFPAALAAGAADLARELAASESRDWMSDGEYEDDACYRLCQHDLATGRPDRLPGTLARWAACQPGPPCPRRRAIEALLAGDASSFDAALVDRLAAIMAENAADAGRIAAADPAFLPNSRLSTEVLALIRLARMHGMVAGAVHPLCPPVMLAAEPPPVEDLFPILEAQQLQARPARRGPRRRG